MGEGMLIVFSVLFALLINKVYDDYLTRQRKKEAVESITKELYRNQAIIKSWKAQHVEIRNTITSIVSGNSDSLKTELKKYPYLNLGVITDHKSLMDAFLTDTAWESTKSANLLSELEFPIVEKLTLIYEMQNVLMDRTMNKILEYYFDTQSHDMNNLDQILIQFQLRFWELTGQESLLEEQYVEAIEMIKE